MGIFMGYVSFTEGGWLILGKFTQPPFDPLFFLSPEVSNNLDLLAC